MADKTRYPPDGVSAETVHEIRRIKARVESERLPRGADPNTHTKLGRGGLADIEWTVQLLQLQHAHEIPALHNTSTLESLDVIAETGLVPADEVDLLRAGVADRHPGPQRAGAGPRQADRPAAGARTSAQCGRGRRGLAQRRRK